MSIENLKSKLLPISRPRMIDLVEQAGFDVSDWSNFKGGAQKASTNPKYCYEWNYEQEGMCILNIWYENTEFQNEHVFQRLNLRTRSTDTTGPRKARAKKFDDAVQHAFSNGANPRVIIQHRPQFGTGGVEERMLDRAPWTVTSYDYSTGDFELQRGVVSVSQTSVLDTELEDFKEGELREKFVLHRAREALLRDKKIKSVLAQNGVLACEVPKCRFNFEIVYGQLGQGFIHVHHLKPLSTLSEAGEKMAIEDLALVCPNCHAMIHRGGACREMGEIIPKEVLDV